MGAKCCGGEKSNPKGEANLMGKGKDMDFKKIPIATVLKAQSLMRGFLVRRRVKRTYGFEMRKGLIGGSFSHNLNPEELEK